MNIRNVLQLPVLLATLGLVAGNHDNKKKMASDCAPLCYAGPILECENNWDVMAAAIYELAAVQGSEVAILADRETPSYPKNGDAVNQPESAWWGFKVGLGYKDWADNWRTSVQYNYFKSVADSNLETAYGQQYVPSAYANQFVINGKNIPTYGFENLEVGNNTLINNLNFLLGRPTLITPNLELTTSYGVSATWLTRRQVAVFSNDTILTAGVPSNYAANLGAYYQNYQKYRWWGVGPMVAVHSAWYLGNRVGLYADAYGALTYGQSNVRTATFSKKTATPGVNTDGYIAAEAALNNSLFQFSPELNFQLGLNWSDLFREDSMKVSFQIGYETTYYFQVMKTPINNISYGIRNGSGLGIQGLVLQGCLDF